MSVSSLATIKGKTEEIELLWFSSIAIRFLTGIFAKRNSSSFLFSQFKIESFESVVEVYMKILCILRILEARQKIISKSE
jgi:hypothetical protein